MKEFDIVNGNPELNSDLDSDSDVDPKSYLNSQMVMEQPGVSPDNYMLKSRIKISVIGKPNVGKSSLVNNMLQLNRALVHDKPHTTADPVGVNFVKNGVKFRLIDTAGLEGHSHMKSELDKMIFNKTMRSVKMADVVVVVIDALEAFRNLDFVSQA